MPKLRITKPGSDFCDFCIELKNVIKTSTDNKMKDILAETL